jgi:nicotinamidase-related amidase
MSLPPFYDPQNAARFAYSPDQASVWSAAHAAGLPPAQSDPRRVHLLLIDVQRDFCFPEGSLYVAGRSGTGAVDDNRRIAELVYRHAAHITDITTTLDTHLAYHIFFPSFWTDAAGAPLAPHREITADDVRSGRVRPNPTIAAWLAGGDVAWLTKQALYYCEELERAGKYKLYLWPPHCLVGSIGHSLAGVIHEARLWHAWARGAQSWVAPKGDHPLTENYSVLRPEVTARHDGGPPLGKRDDELIDRLLAADVLLVAGQAASHCVKSSVDDLLDAIRARDVRLARKVVVLTDCMSAVTVPDGAGGLAVDFTPQAEAAFARWADAGMTLARSTNLDL